MSVSCGRCHGTGVDAPGVNDNPCPRCGGDGTFYPEMDDRSVLADRLVVAYRLDGYSRGTPKMDGSEEVFLPKYRDKPGQVPATLPNQVVDDLRAAAKFLRESPRPRCTCNPYHVIGCPARGEDNGEG